MNMDVQQILGWEGTWEYREDGSPDPQLLTLSAGRVLHSGETIGSYVADGRKVSITFEPKGEALADTLVAERGQNLDVATGHRRYSFADDVSEEDGGTGPLTVIADLKRIRP